MAVMKTDLAKLNLRRAAVLDFYVREMRLPSFAEMMPLFEVQSKNAVAKVVSQLEKREVLKRSGDGHISLGAKAFAIPLLGEIGAGFPMPTQEDLGDAVALDSLLIVNRNSTFLLTVFGDSMVEAGIMPKDIVLVDTSLTPRPNDIVIACVDDDWTMKYFCRDERGRVYLQAANSKYPRIYPQEKLIIHSVVVSSVRCYR